MSVWGVGHGNLVQSCSPTVAGGLATFRYGNPGLRGSSGRDDDANWPDAAGGKGCQYLPLYLTPL